MKNERDEDTSLNKDITLKNVREVIFGFNIPGFNMHNDGFMRIQAELVAKVANDPIYTQYVENFKKAMADQDMIGLEKVFLEKEEYVRRKFGGEKMYNKGTERAAFCALTWLTGSVRE